MAQKSEMEKGAEGASPSRAPPASAAATVASTDNGPRGVRLNKPDRRQYLIASRRRGGVTPLGVMPFALNVVEQALRASNDVEVVDVIGPRSTLGALADGMAGAPDVIVARMHHDKAAQLHEQAQGQLIVEADQPLSLLDGPIAPPLVAASVAGAPPLLVDMLVLGSDETPVEGAEVYIYGSLLPTMGVTNNAGKVTLSVLGDTPQSIRALYVKPKSDYWSFYQSQPNVDATQPNIVVLRPLSEKYPSFPGQQTMGWGQRAMRLDQIPPDRRGQGVKIAVVDSGAATSHEDLRGIARGFDALEKNNGTTGNWMVDTIAHGSHCAGVIAGNRENNIGIVGFAPAAEVHACKIFPGGQISHLIDALEYCIEQRVDLVNLSLGTDQISELLEQQLTRVASLGIACIVAAGNSGGPVQYPASSPNVLAVAAIGRLGEFPPDSYHAQTVQGMGPDGYFSPRFTCFGPEIALCAPGVAILSSVPPNAFAVWDGTSMAAPHVTGVAALVLAHHPDFAGPFKARNAQRVQRLFQILKASARPIGLGDPRRTGFGIPDVPTALGLQLDSQAFPQSAQNGFGHQAVQTTQPQWFSPSALSPMAYAAPAPAPMYSSPQWPASYAPLMAMMANRVPVPLPGMGGNWGWWGSG